MTFFSFSNARPPRLTISAAVAIVVGITAWRIVMLAFNRTDLFVDEAQYWLWGQHLDFGYYSKPPMIGWVIRLFTEIGQSDATFFVRLAAPLFHMASALLLMLLAMRCFDRQTAAWTGISFATLPAVSLSSVLMSTDTIQLTFLAIAILLYIRMTKAPSAMAAAGLGVALGLAFMTKYSVLFLLPGVGIAILTMRSARISWRDAFITAIVGAIIVAPNLWWNFANDATTIQHTEQIAGWSKDSGKSGFSITSGLGFFAAQFGVVGPFIFAAMLWPIGRMIRGSASDTEKLLVLLSLPCIALITIQAFFGSANANWGVPAYVAGTVLACGAMMTMPFWVMRTSLAIGAFIAIAIPFLTVFPDIIKLPNGDLAMQRYVGRSEISRFVADTARKENMANIVAGDRGILADLFYTLRDDGLKIYATPPAGFPDSYYQQRFPMPSQMPEPVLYVATRVISCGGEPAEVLASMTMTYGYRRGQVVQAQKVPPSCLTPETRRMAGR
jgi:lipid A galacturonosyltransferase RgtD